VIWSTELRWPELVSATPAATSSMYTPSILQGRRAIGRGPTGTCPGVGRLAYLAAAEYEARVLFQRPRPGHE
jgi:hypothetical protein